MPTHKVKGGYRWGKHGKVYPTKKQADKQGQAIYASGWQENNIKENCEINMIKISENELYGIIKESIKRVLKENVSNYTHYAVNKKTNLIVNGWDYAGYNSDELRQYKNDYFNTDLIDYGFNPKDYKILTKKACIRQGINPDDEMNYWSNDGLTPLNNK